MLGKRDKCPFCLFLMPLNTQKREIQLNLIIMKTALRYVCLWGLMSISSFAFAQDIYISEIYFVPPGPDTTEFIELRGIPNAVVPADTYFVGLEGDPGSSAGKVRFVMELAGRTFGNNGYMAFVMSSSTYPTQVDNEGTIFFNDGNSGWVGLASVISQSNDDMQDLSATFLIITAPEAPASGNDADSDDDGVIDRSGWVVLDGVSILDDDLEGGGKELANAEIVFSTLTEENITMSPTANFVQTISDGSEWEGDYVSRIGHSTGSTIADWFCSDSNSSGGDMPPFSTSGTKNTDSDFGNLEFISIGGPNFEITYSADGFEPADPRPTLNLKVDLSLSSSADIACHDLTVAADQTLTINAGHTLTVNGNVKNLGSIIIKSGASLITQGGASVTGNVTIERNTSFADGRYSFVGTPVEMSGDITGSDLGDFVNSYDETVGFDNGAGINRWIDAAGMTLVPGKGYTQADQEVLTFSGIPNAGDIMVAGLTKTTAGTSNAGDQGWHLLSNPYAAAIDVSKFLMANLGIAASISIWEDGGSDTGRRSNADYLTSNAIATVNGSSKSFEGYIGSAQGFFVQANTDGIEVVFNDSIKVTGNNADANFFRKSIDSTPGVKLTLSDLTNSHTNELFVGLLENATSGVDRLYDAPKLLGNQDLQFFSLIADSRYAIQGIPFEENISTELAFNLGANANMEVNVAELNGLEDGMTFLLYDVLSGELHDLSTQRSIQFAGTKGSDQNRFVLTYAALGVLSVDVNQLAPIYRFADNVLNVTFPAELSVESLMVYDLSGKIISTKEALGESITELIIPIKNDGINIVKIVTSEGVFTRKFIF